MKPIKFPQATQELKKPPTMTDAECNPLCIYEGDDGHNISCWTASFWKRLKFLFHGKLWLGIVSGKNHPPVWIRMEKKGFKED